MTSDNEKELIASKKIRSVGLDCISRILEGQISDGVLYGQISDGETVHRIQTFLDVIGLASATY